MSGKIDTSQLNVPPEEHELATAEFFSSKGKDIVFLRPSQIPESRTPDIKMDGVEWEIKSPLGDGKRTISKNFKKAAAQSRYIIFDLRRCGLPESQSISQLKKEFDLRSSMRRLLVIKKNDELLEFSK